MRTFVQKVLAVAAAVAFYAGTASAGFEVQFYSTPTPASGSGSSSTPYKISDGSAAHTAGGTFLPDGITDSVATTLGFNYNGYSVRLTANVTPAGATGTTVGLNVTVSRLATATGGVTFTFIVSRTGVAAPPDNNKQISDALTLQTTSGGAGSSTYESFVSAPQTLYNQSSNDSGVYGPLPIAGSPSAVSGLIGGRVGSVVPGNPFTITTITTLAFTSGSDTTIQLTASTTVQQVPGVPAPGGLLLGLLGLPALRLARRSVLA